MTRQSDSHSDTVLLSYQELADRLGIDVLSARRRVLRSKWPKTKGNDGKARIAVPLIVLPPVTVTVVPAATPTDVPTDVPTQPPSPPPVVLTADTLSQLLAQIGDAAELRERLGRAELRAELSETARLEAEAGRRAAEAERNALRDERDALRFELRGWSSGNPLARAWRSLWYRRAR